MTKIARVRASRGPTVYVQNELAGYRALVSQVEADLWLRIDRRVKTLVLAGMSVPLLGLFQEMEREL